MRRAVTLFFAVAAAVACLAPQALGAGLPPAGAAEPAAAAVAPPQGKNTIFGHVFDAQRRPLSDIHVELLNEVYSTIARTKTVASGRYSFNHLSSGNFKVRVLPYGTIYQEQTRDITIVNVSVAPGGGSDYAQLDFYLIPRKGAYGPFAAPGEVFAQEVPGEARRLYERGVNFLLEKNDKEAFENLKRAIETFPTYHAALDRLGTEYVVRGHYEAAFILLTKSVEVNPRSFSSTFGLGVAQYHLKHTEDAVATLRRASTLYGKSVDVHLWHGMASKRAGKLDQAEASFKTANQLGKGKVAEVHWQLARLYSEQNRYAEAADELELYLKTQQQKRPDAEKITQLVRQLREKAAGGKSTTP